jgi:hypothetical protein
MPQQPLSDAETATIRRMHADGASLRAIARETGRHVTTVSRWCKREGLKFDRARTAAATAAASVDFAARRAVIQQRYLDIADELQQRATAAAPHAQPAGADGEVRRWTTERPEPREVADLLRAATAATNAELRLADYRARDSHEDAGEIVLAFDVAVKRAYVDHQADPDA